MDESHDKKSYLDIKELAAQTGLGEATIWRWKRAGKIPFFQPGGKNGRVMFPRDAIERALGEAPKPESNKNAPPKRLPGPQPRWMSPTHDLNKK